MGTFSLPVPPLQAKGSHWDRDQSLTLQDDSDGVGPEPFSPRAQGLVLGCGEKLSQGGWGGSRGPGVGGEPGESQQELPVRMGWSPDLEQLHPHRLPGQQSHPSLAGLELPTQELHWE